jgi:hydrogenase maturation protease
MLSLQPRAGTAPVLVLAIGNPSRGDDALGPLAAQRLAALALPGVEVLTDFQLQVEHALDLLGRSLVVFIDAAASGEAPFELRPLEPAADARHTSHSLSPAAVLDAYVRLTGREPPPAHLLAIRGHHFELGAALSFAAARNLRQALSCVRPMLVHDAAPAGVQALPRLETMQHVIG